MTYLYQWPAHTDSQSQAAAHAVSALLTNHRALHTEAATRAVTRNAQGAKAAGIECKTSQPLHCKLCPEGLKRFFLSVRLVCHQLGHRLTWWRCALRTIRPDCRRKMTHSRPFCSGGSECKWQATSRLTCRPRKSACAVARAAASAVMSHEDW